MIETTTKILLLSVLVIVAIYIAIINTLTYESQKEDTRLTEQLLKHLEYE